jgi:hypothetical protein
MTAPLPPTSGPISSQERLAAEDHGTPPDIQAPSQVAAVTAEFDGATAAGKAWQSQAGQVLESPQGFGSGGYSITMPDPDGDEPWSSSSMMFPHQGP